MVTAMITADSQALTMDARVELFQLTAPAGAQFTTEYFTPSGTNGDMTPISFMGQIYQPWPIKCEGFERTVQGAAPRPTLTVSNAFQTSNGAVYGIFTQLVRQYRGLAGWKLNRIVTYAKFLDGGPLAGSPEFHQQETWLINRRTQDDGATISFELVSYLDLEGKKAPNQMLSAYCPAQVVYRGASCGYTGTAMFDVNDFPTTDPKQDICGKRLQSCKCRFPNQPLPFPGAPGLRRLQ